VQCDIVLPAVAEPPSSTEPPACHVWADGELIAPGRLAVSAWDHGFLYGDGVFEGIRLRAGRLYRPDGHLARLRRSARIVAIDPPRDDDGILAAIRECCAANDLDDAHVRVIVTRGTGRPGIDPARCGRASLYVLAYPFEPLLGSDPIALVTSSVTRKAPRSIDAAVKSLNYLDSVMAKLQAGEAGAGDALMLDGEGYVAEATGANVFGVRDGVLFTPTPTAALPGITRDTVLRLARADGRPAEERRTTLGDLIAADEVFLTGTAAGIVPVRSIDGRPLPEAPGPVTRWVDEAYRATWVLSEWTVPLR
jgi:branched-chain amino acid aminotransferase